MHYSNPHKYNTYAMQFMNSTHHQENTLDKRTNTANIDNVHTYNENLSRPPNNNGASSNQHSRDNKNYDGPINAMNIQKRFPRKIKNIVQVMKRATTNFWNSTLLPREIFASLQENDTNTLIIYFVTTSDFIMLMLREDLEISRKR